MMLFCFQLALAAFTALAVPTVVCSQRACTTIGLRCSDDCTNIQLCDSIGNYHWNVVYCNSTYSKYCLQNPSSGNFECTAEQCSSPYVPHRFYCTDAGTFPSPFNCDVSYICSGRGSYPTLTCTCESGQYYDVVTNTCVPAPGCPLIPADCSSYGRIGDLGNGFCYTCHQILSALVFRCPSSTTTTTETTITTQPGSTRGMTCTQYVIPPAPTNGKVHAV